MNRYRNSARKKASGDELILTADDDTSAAEIDGTLNFGETGGEPGSDDFDEQVQHAQEQLCHLRQQQEMIERQKTEIEELKRQRQELSGGRSDVTEKLNRAVVMLEREIYESQKKAEQFAQAKESLSHHLEVVSEVKPEDWSKDDMRGNLSHSLGVIEDAREEYRNLMARVSSLLDGSSAEEFASESMSLSTGAFGSPAMESDWFRIWLRRGFAFSLPLIGFGMFALLFNALFG